MFCTGSGGEVAIGAGEGTLGWGGWWNWTDGGTGVEDEAGGAGCAGRVAGVVAVTVPGIVAVPPGGTDPG